MTSFVSVINRNTKLLSLSQSRELKSSRQASRAGLVFPLFCFFRVTMLLRGRSPESLVSLLPIVVPIRRDQSRVTSASYFARRQKNKEGPQTNHTPKIGKKTLPSSASCDTPPPLCPQSTGIQMPHAHKHPVLFYFNVSEAENIEVETLITILSHKNEEGLGEITLVKLIVPVETFSKKVEMGVGGGRVQPA